VLSVDVTARIVKDGVETIETVPVAADGSTRSTVGTSIRVRVNRHLEPSSATRQAICVQSSTALIDSLEQCSGGLVLRPTYDPVGPDVTYYLETDSTELAPDTLYRVTLFRSEGENGFGLRTFDGGTLSGFFAVEFRTEVEPTDPAALVATTDAPPRPSFCKELDCKARCKADGAPPGCASTCSTGVADVLEACASGGCHQAAPSGGPVPMGLELYSAEALQMTAIAHVAHGTERGPAAQNPDVAGVQFGRAMPIISPGDPGNSYLLYKILANPAFAREEGFARDEVTRLRSAVVVGAPMPPTTKLGGRATNLPLSQENARVLSAWIAAGADTSTCGPPVAAP